MFGDGMRSLSGRRPMVCFFLVVAMMAGGDKVHAQERPDDLVPLPPPRLDGTVSVERALQERRSVRQYADRGLAHEEIAQLLWAAQGITEAIAERPASWPAEWQWMGGLRTAPSAGALYPLELYVVAADVEGLDDGLYRYVPQEHALQAMTRGDLRQALTDAALRQAAIARAPAVFVVAAVYQRVAVKYGERAERYAQIEAGAVAQNLYLQCEALDLGAVLMGAFDDAAVKRALEIPADHEPLVIMPVGRKAAG